MCVVVNRIDIALTTLDYFVKRHDAWKEGMSNILPDGTPLDTKEGPCAICLEETITNPVVLPCGHAFCFSCVGHYQKSNSKKGASCPYCRGEFPNMMEKAEKRAQLYADRAVASSKGSEDQKKYGKLALAELGPIVDLFSSEDSILDPENKAAHMDALRFKVMMTSMTDQPEEVITATKEVLLLAEKYPGILNFDDLSDVKCLQAEAYLNCSKWNKAGKIYESLIREYLQLREDPNDLVYMGCSRAYYELQQYDKAIEIGNLAVEDARFRLGVHKYVALSQKALGDIDEAKKTITHAILYEEHWHEDNLQKNKQLLRELNNL